MTEFPVKYNGVTYDVGKFRERHPGGTKNLDQFKNKDITKVMTTTGHGPLAYRLLEEYRPHIVHKEDGINWSKPLIAQLPSLKESYNSWVYDPVDRNFRVFPTELGEILSTSTWKQVLVAWVPWVFVLVKSSLLCFEDQGYTEGSLIGKFLSCYLSGLLLWPFLEYIFHRFCFHFRPPGHSAFLIRFQFGVHGVHHKAPFDSRRLLFPPVPAAIIALTFYTVFCYVFGSGISEGLMAGLMTGYLIYDMTHYYLHYGNPSPGSYMYNLKRYHHRHHFVEQQNGFGVTNTVVDALFNTKMTIKDLKGPLRWD